MPTILKVVQMARKRPTTTRFVSGHRVWQRLRAEMRRRRRGMVAVAFLGRGSFERIRLAPGSTLIVNASDDAVKTGQTSPYELSKFIRASVRVYSSDSLHAKVFVLGQKAFVGSANSSGSSENRLDEAMLSTMDLDAVSDARKFIAGLAVDKHRIGPEETRRLMRLYRPPTLVMHGSQRQFRRLGLVVVRLSFYPWTEAANDAGERGLVTARRRLKSSRLFRIQEFDWGRAGLERLAPGRSVIQRVRRGNGRVMIEPPGRVVHVEKYREGSSQGGVVFLEIQRGPRARPLTRVRQQVGLGTTRLLGPKGPMRVASKSQERSLRALFEKAR